MWVLILTVVLEYSGPVVIHSEPNFHKFTTCDKASKEWLSSNYVDKTNPYANKYRYACVRL